MALVDCSSEMSKYHVERVTLRQSDQGEMRTRRDAGRSRLSSGLERDKHPLPAETASQGSYAMRTMVQDTESDYDIDDGAYFRKDDFKDKNGKDLTPYEARLRICNALIQDDRLKYPAEIHNNCVRQKYPEGYHIDIPVYRIISGTDVEGNPTTNYELASKDRWTPSDARGVTRWYEAIVGSLNKGDEDGSQLRRITRLTKKFARSRSHWKEEVPSGICLTKLVVECFVASTDRDDLSLYETWKRINDRLANSCKVDHPVIAGSTLADEYDGKVLFFRRQLSNALSDLKIADDSACSKKKALSVWDGTFNTGFFSEQYVETKEPQRSSTLLASLISPLATAKPLTFPDRPVIPNKPAGFA